MAYMSGGNAFYGNYGTGNVNTGGYNTAGNNGQMNNGFQTTTTQTTQNTVPSTSYAPPSSQYVPCRIVENEQSIIANEVPTNGNIGVFVCQDMSVIYTKAWGADGYIHTNVYQLVKSQGPQTDPMAEIINRLQRIEQRLDTPMPKQKYYPKNNKYNKNNQNKKKEDLKND